VSGREVGEREGQIRVTDDSAILTTQQDEEEERTRESGLTAREKELRCFL